MSVSTFGPRDKLQNSRKEPRDISQINELGTGMSFYQKLKEKKLSVNSETIQGSSSTLNLSNIKLSFANNFHQKMPHLARDHSDVSLTLNQSS